jgi:hypothetical protein
VTTCNLGDTLEVLSLKLSIDSIKKTWHQDTYKMKIGDV